MKIENSDYFSGWRTWGLPFFAALMAPWITIVANMSLISESFQPQLNIGASIIGPVACFITFAYVKHVEPKTNERILVSTFSAFLALIILCLALKRTIGIVYFPGEYLQIFIWWIWSVIYLSIFFNLGSELVVASIILRR